MHLGGNWGIPAHSCPLERRSSPRCGFPRESARIYRRMCWLEYPKPGKKVIHKFFWFGNTMTWGIFHRCDICAADEKTALLSNRQLQLINKLYQVLDEQLANNERKSLFSVSQEQLCICYLLRNKWSLDNLCKDLFRHPHGNMQTDPHTPNPSEATNEPPKNKPHEYNCDCDDCQRKYGSLPLLVQVIEGQEKSSQEQSASISSSDNTVDLNSVNLSEPSTSCALTSSPKKAMLCPHCPKTFTHRGDLNKHLRKHTGEQPYTCDVCNRKFAHTSNLNRHLKVHSGDRPFVCNVCNKNFSRKDKLDMHKKTKLCKKFSEKT